MLMGSGPRFLHRELKGRLANASPSRLVTYIHARHWKFHGPAGTASRAPQVPGRSIARAVALPGLTWPHDPATVFAGPPTVAGVRRPYLCRGRSSGPGAGLRAARLGKRL